MRNMRSSTSHPKVSIIVLNWNGLEDTIECLESLKKITYPNYEAIVVDNGSEGRDVEALRHKFGNYIQLIENDRNYGFAEGNNIGMRYAFESSAHDYILLLNNDTVVDAKFLVELVTVAESDERIGIVGPVIYDYYDPARVRSAGVSIDWRKGVASHQSLTPHAAEQSGTMREVESIDGCCMMVKRQMIEKVGMLDPEYFAYSEESDWCVRAKRKGYKICCALSSKIWHKAPHSYLDSHRLYYFLRNDILFMRKKVPIAAKRNVAGTVTRRVG
jgi:hypothetical protein